MITPDRSRISQPRSVESTERDYLQQPILEIQTRDIEVLSHEPIDTAEAQSDENAGIQPTTEPSDEPELLGSAKTVLVTVETTRVEVTVAG